MRNKQSSSMHEISQKLHVLRSVILRSIGALEAGNKYLMSQRRSAGRLVDSRQPLNGLEIKARKISIEIGGECVFFSFHSFHLFAM